MEGYNKFILVFLLVAKCASQNCPTNDLECYENLINVAEMDGLTYTLPKNAFNHKPNSDEIFEFGSYDFIIVGSGAGGSVLAHRLSGVLEWNILLLEAGTYGDTLTDIPNMYFPVEYTKYNWGFESVPQTTACLGMENNVCPLPRGKGIGGTTLINGLVYSRGSILDFDRWEGEGNPGWSHEDVKPLFLMSENFHHRDVDAPVNLSVHGFDGPLNVEYHLPRSPQLNAFLAANEELGYYVTDYNSGTGLGVSPAQICTKNGVRFDGGKAFVTPIKERKNLHILTESYVTKVIIDDNNIATGVIFANNKTFYRANAKKEVIVSAGTYQTAQLLMLSGIGPRNHLESLGIEVRSDLRVGYFLDHPTFYGFNIGTNYTEPLLPLSDYILEYFEGEGPLAAPGNNQGVGFYESSFTKGTGLPDIEIMLVPSNATTPLSRKSFNLKSDIYEQVWGQFDPANTMVFYIVCLHAISEGTIRLNNSDPFEYPLIDPKYLSDEYNRDINVLYEGVQLALRLIETEAFRAINATLQGEISVCTERHGSWTEDYWFCALRLMTMDLYHPIASARMGLDPQNGAVVNHDAKVYGINRLRVADASIIPFSLAGHPNAPTVMIGEYISKKLIAEYFKQN